MARKSSSKGKNNKKKVIIAMVLVGVAIIGLFNAMKSKKPEPAPAPPPQVEAPPPIPEIAKSTAVLAIQEIKVGDTFTTELFEEKEYNEDALPEGYFKNIAMLIGKKAGKNIVKGQFITTAEILSDEMSTIEIPNGMRAISIPVNKFQGLASYIRVGSSVDLLKASSPPEFIAQNVRIISFEAAGGYNQNSPTKMNSQYLTATQASAITFLVPTDLVSTIIKNMLEGQFQVISRNNNDEKLIVTEEDLPPPPLDLPQELPEDPEIQKAIENPRLPEADPWKITLIQGTEVTTIEEDSILAENKIEGSQTTNNDLKNLNNLKELLDLVK